MFAFSVVVIHYPRTWTSLHFTIQLIKFWKFSFHQNIKSNKLKKSSKEDFFTWWNMHEILNKLKIRTVQFLVKFLLENRSRVKILSKLTFFSSKILNKLKIRIIFASNSISLRILSLLKIFELKKVSLFRILTRDWYFEEKISKTKWFEFWAYSKSHAYAVTCIWHLPRTFWAYSRYPPYQWQLLGLSKYATMKNCEKYETIRYIDNIGCIYGAYLE